MVNFNKKRAGLHKRRAVSTIVGAAIFLVLFASASSTFFIAMDVQRDTINTQRVVSDSIMEKSKEKFSIAVSTDDSNNNRLGIQVKNQGTNPVEIGNIWIVNNSGSFPATKYLIDYKDSVIPPGYGSNILENTPLFMHTDDYDIKVVSTFGTIAKSELNVGASNNMRADLIAIPPEVKVGENVTLTMHVENIGNTRLLNVVPNGDYPNIIPPFTSPVPPVPAPVDLDPGEGVFFTWKYITTGGVGTIVDFDSFATATEEDTGFALSSNIATESIELQQPDVSDIIVLTQDLLARPEIFATIPGPFGVDAEKALWGINIVNPTPQPLYVNKIVISAITTRATGGDEIFDAGGTCNPTNVPPTPAGTWRCPVNNQLLWENPASPALVPGYSVVPFAVRVGPGTLSGGPTDVLENIPLSINVFTTLGQFGKSGYGSSVDNGGSGLVNVYLTDNPGSTSNNDILLNVTKIQSSSIIKLNATLADFDTGGSQYIDTNSRLIINIPKGWTNPSVINAPGFSIQPIQTYSDGSSQIVGVLTSTLTGVGGTAQTIEFQVTAPAVTSTQLYVMYILADGSTTLGDNAVGSLAEVLLQVIP
ncbi:MAG: hypothetical protein ACHQ1D_03325 [Nitrososphaerales archaeon]